jgi:four helix bundle protein
MKQFELKDRTKGFAHRCVKAALSLSDSVLSRHVKGQLIRSSTSVAANYRAVCLAHSKASFASKLSIVIEEADESLFWMEFAVEEKLIRKNLLSTLMDEAAQLTSIFISSRKTIQTKK